MWTTDAATSLAFALALLLGSVGLAVKAWSKTRRV